MLPTIEQYRDALSAPQGLLRRLAGVQPQRDIYDEVVAVAGNRAAVFRVRLDGAALCRTAPDEKAFTGSAPGGTLLGGMASDGVDMALKCYFRPNPGARQLYDYLASNHSPLLCRAELLPGELYVYDNDGRGQWVDVVVSQWVEGRTLEREMALAAQPSAASSPTEARLSAEGWRGSAKGGNTTLADSSSAPAAAVFAALEQSFLDLAAALLDAPWAHGDFKPENIIVGADGTMKLIDYDALWFPGMTATEGREIGTPGYQHPSRDHTHAGKQIDHYPIALIASSLHLLARDPQLYARRGVDESVLFDPEAILARRAPLYEQCLAQARSTDDQFGTRLLELLSSLSPEIPALNMSIKISARRIKSLNIFVP